MLGETPNIDRIGHEDAMFVDCVAMQSCTSGRYSHTLGNTIVFGGAWTLAIPKPAAQKP